MPVQVVKAEAVVRQHSGHEEPIKMTFKLSLVLLAAVLGGLCFGLDIGVAATTSMNPFRDAFGIPELKPNQQDSPETVAKLSLFVVLFHVFTLVGAPFAGMLSDKFGRKPVIMIAVTIQFFGVLWQCLSGLLGNNTSRAWTSVLLGRCLGGIGNGFILTIMPVYAAELSPKQLRGIVGTCFQLFITLGILLMSFVNEALAEDINGWRICVGLEAIPNFLILLLAIFVLPESPKYLVKINEVEKARDALNQLTNYSQESVVQAEISEIVAEVNELEAIGSGGFKELFQGQTLPAFLCGFFVAFCQNVTGINWFMNYGTTIFSSLGLNPFTFDIILKSINSAATIAAMFLVDRFGRKFLTLWGTILIIVTFALIFSVIIGTGVDVTAPLSSLSGPLAQKTYVVQMFMVVMMFFFIVCFAITWGPLGWIVPGEVFPLRVRSVGMGACIVGNMLSNIVLGDFGFQVMSVSSLGIPGTMGIIVLFNFVIVLPTVLFLQPETKGVSLEDMRYVFAYENGGSEHSKCMKEFYRRNLRQAANILVCRSVDPNLEVEEGKNVHKTKGSDPHLSASV